MTVQFRDHEIQNTTKKYISNYIKNIWGVQDHQVVFCRDGNIKLKNNLGETFAIIGKYQNYANN